MATFELVLANGRRVATDDAKEIYYFHKSGGTSIRPKQKPKTKQNKAKKLAKAG